MAWLSIFFTKEQILRSGEQIEQGHAGSEVCEENAAET
jgi:hypothetical protein